VTVCGALYKPQDPGVVCAYGTFLFEVMSDISGAERQYQKALELDRHHVLANANMATIHHTVTDNAKKAQVGCSHPHPHPSPYP
jgi:Flp pilus assembly protein TadD